MSTPSNTLTNEALAVSTLADAENGTLQVVPQESGTPSLSHQSSGGFLSFLWSPVSSLFGMTTKTEEIKPTIVQVEERPADERKQKTYTEWFGNIVQKFGTDAGKTMSDTLKDPLTQLAKSPVLRTGEVLVVHSVDFESIRLKKILYYLFTFILFGRLSKHVLDRMFLGKPRAVPAITDKKA